MTTPVQLTYPGATVDTLLTTLKNSNLSATHKITRSATIVVAASDSSAKSKAQADYVCDGTADNVEIQAAINALPSHGGHVLCLDGNYSIASDILPKNNTMLTGSGNGTVLTLADSVPENHAIIGLIHSDNVIVSRMVLDGNKANQSDVGSYFVFEGINLSSASHCLISDMYIRNTYADGIDIDGGSDITIVNYRAENCRGCAVHISQLDPQRVIVKNVHSYSNGIGMNRPAFDVYNDGGVSGDYCIFDACISYNDHKGFSIAGGTYNTVNDCKVIDPVMSCITIAGDSQTISNSNFLKTNGVGGMVYLDATNSNFTNNHILSTLDVGMYIQGTNILLSGNNFITKSTPFSTQGTGLQKSLVVGNRFKHLGTDPAGRGINLDSNSSNNTFLGNYIEKGTWTLYIDAGCDNNIFSNNYLQIGGAGVIKNLGTGTKISNNAGYVNENTGTATITAPETTVDVTHGLAAAPTRVILSPTTDTAGKRFWVSAKGATTFTISIDSAADADISFDWQAVV